MIHPVFDHHEFVFRRGKIAKDLIGGILRDGNDFIRVLHRSPKQPLCRQGIPASAVLGMGNGDHVMDHRDRLAKLQAAGDRNIIQRMKQPGFEFLQQAGQVPQHPGNPGMAAGLDMPPLLGEGLPPRLAVFGLILVLRDTGRNVVFQQQIVALGVKSDKIFQRLGSMGPKSTGGGEKTDVESDIKRRIHLVNCPGSHYCCGSDFLGS